MKFKIKIIMLINCIYIHYLQNIFALICDTRLYKNNENINLKVKKVLVEMKSNTTFISLKIWIL